VSLSPEGKYVRAALGATGKTKKKFYFLFFVVLKKLIYYFNTHNQNQREILNLTMGVKPVGKIST